MPCKRSDVIILPVKAILIIAIATVISASTYQGSSGVEAVYVGISGILLSFYSLHLSYINAVDGEVVVVTRRIWGSKKAIINKVTCLDVSITRNGYNSLVGDLVFDFGIQFPDCTADEFNRIKAIFTKLKLEVKIQDVKSQAAD